jgi:hypothetical protein
LEIWNATKSLLDDTTTRAGGDTLLFRSIMRRLVPLELLFVGQFFVENYLGNKINQGILSIKQYKATSERQLQED